MSSPWPLVALEEVLTQDLGYIDTLEARQYPKLSVRLYGKGVALDAPVYGSLVKMKRHQLAKAGQVILSEIWGKKGAVGLVPDLGEGALCTSHFFLFDLKRESIDPRWLQALFSANYLEEHLGAHAKGTTSYAAVRPSMFLNCEIPLPPLSEQQRIVARIEKVAEKAEEAHALRRLADQEAEALRSSLQGQLFDRLGSIHPTRTFGSFSPHITSGPRNWGKRYQEDGYRFYRAQDIKRDGSLTSEGKVFLAPPTGQQGRTAMLEDGDLMLVITGATVGRAALYSSVAEPGFVSQHVAICRLPKDQVDSRFAWWAMTVPAGQAQLLGQRYGQGKPGLNLTNIRNLQLPVPPLPEQQRVVRELDELEATFLRLQATQQSMTEELERVVPAILDRAFKGEL